ncbi:MAG: hypothetical protein GY738_29755 [Pseudoalteromonas sp.]|nr:hypothetical protein [Pseudoalteromonas sp.]
MVKVKVGKLDVFSNEEGYTPTRSVLTILSDEVIARKGFRIGFAGKFSFLETGDRNVKGRNKGVEFILGGKETIAVELENERFTRRFAGNRGRRRLGRGRRC